MENKKYSIIYADPPWQYKDNGCEGNMFAHYDGMSLKDIKLLKINSITNNNSILFLWVTFPCLQEAFDVIKSWGFIYKTVAFTWLKVNKKQGNFFFGIGHYTRSNAEICLIAIKGKPKIESKCISSIVITPKYEHSKKPDIIRRKIVELCGDLPRIELFARGDIIDHGWDFWGNERNNSEEINL